MKVRAIITGSTGMVGEGVLLECLSSDNVEQVLVLNRRAGGISHPKLREVLVEDFFDLSGVVSELEGYNACFFCLGVSSVGISRAEYRRITYDLTLNFARALAAISREMTFCYVSGAGTDGTQHSRLEWARVKGATENALLELFERAYMFRPGVMQAIAGQQRLKTPYRLLAWLYPVGRAISPALFCTLREVADAMIHVALRGAPKRVLEVTDIVALANT